MEEKILTTETIRIEDEGFNLPKSDLINTLLLLEECENFCDCLFLENNEIREYLIKKGIINTNEEKRKQGVHLISEKKRVSLLNILKGSTSNE